MKKYPYQEAKATIQTICRAAAAGEFDTREKFLNALEEHPHIAAQGYNPHGKIFLWNPASAEIYGHSEAAAVNEDLFELIIPEEMRNLARDAIRCAMKTGRVPEASACDLVRHDGALVTVYSGHLVFKWETSSPEFYCIDIPLDNGSDN